MTQRIDLPNLGRVVVEQLQRAGIDSPEELRCLGSVNAAVRLAEAGVEVCSSKLAALEGPIRGVRWPAIPAEERAALRAKLEARRG
jgi:DNA transformation protein